MKQFERKSPTRIGSVAAIFFHHSKINIFLIFVTNAPPTKVCDKAAAAAAAVAAAAAAAVAAAAAAAVVPLG